MNFDILLLSWVFTVVCKAIHYLFFAFQTPVRVPFCFSLCQTTSSHPYIDNFLTVMLLQLSEYLANSLYSVNIYWVKEWWMINTLNESINKKCFLANHVKESTVLWSKYYFLLANESTVLWRKYYFLLAGNKILPTSMLRKKL